MESSETAKTVIGEDVEIVGSVKCSGSIQIDGRLNGDLTCSGNAIIGPSANVKGNLSVNSVTLHGHVNGNITAKDRIQFKATANMNGDIRGKRLSVEDGVTFVGKSEVNPSGSPQRPASGGETAPAPQPAEAAAAGDRDSDAKQDGRSRPAMFGKR